MQLPFIYAPRLRLILGEKMAIWCQIYKFRNKGIGWRGLLRFQTKTQVIAPLDPTITEVLRQGANQVPAKPTLGQFVHFLDRLEFAFGQYPIRHGKPVIHDFADKLLWL
jgi:hypothetical protein